MQGYDYDPQDVVKKAFQYCPYGTARYITINRVMDDVHISIVIETEEVAVPENLATYKGVFAYVFNVDYEIGSELGYIFFEKDGQGNYHRVG